MRASIDCGKVGMGGILMERYQLRWQSIGHLLEWASEEYSDKTMLIFEGARVSFVAMNRRVNRVANALKNLGVQKGDRVSVMLPNGFEFPMAWLAIGKLGAVMVPTNITYKEHDLAFLLNDSGASCMIVHQEYVPLLERVRNRVTGLKQIIVVGDAQSGYQSLDALTQAESDTFAIGDVSENDLLNLQFTSGTTGFPKGCMLTHRYWLLMGQLSSDHIHIRGDDVDMTVQPFYYMDPQWNLMLCLINGIPLVVMDRFSPSRFWQTVKDFGVTFFYVIGTMPFYLLKQPEDPELEKNHKVRAVLCSGIYPQFHATFEQRWNVPWREAFGMTETGVDLLVPLEDAASVGSGAMGCPVPTKQARVVDAEDHAVLDGQTGELVLRGEPMMLGYWNKPDATAEAMRGGWFHTGDLVYKDEKGYYHWVARLKDMVRRSGENISTSEVEGVLLEHPKIKLAAIVPVPDELRGEEVKAYIVLKEGETRESVPPQEIIAHAKAKLAYFKVPRYIEYADDLPLTPSEKIAKHKLVAVKPDLRVGAYDSVDNVWR
jgi:acyl-CoA synthetase (AMP-forming)/AMP-acid ligase II